MKLDERLFNGVQEIFIVLSSGLVLICPFVVTLKELNNCRNFVFVKVDFHKTISVCFISTVDRIDPF